MKESGIDFESYSLILALAPLGEAKVPLSLVTLRAALLQALDLVPFSDSKEEYARRYVRALFPFATSSTTRKNRAEFDAVCGAVVAGGRIVLSAPAHHRCVDDRGGWDAVFPPFFGSPVDDPAEDALEVWLSRRVALSASEAPIAMVECVNTPRRRGLLVLPDDDRLVLDVPGGVRNADADIVKRGGLPGGPRYRIRSGEESLAAERTRVASKSFERGEMHFAAEAVFHSTKAAGCGFGYDKTGMVTRSGEDVVGGGDRNVRPWSGPKGSGGGRPAAVVFLDEAMASISLPGYRSCFSPPTSHRAGGNGQLCLIADDSPVLAIEWCSAYTLGAGKNAGPGKAPSAASGAEGGALDLGSLSVSTCPLAALPCFQLVETRVCLDTSSAKEMMDEKGPRGSKIRGAIEAAQKRKKGEEEEEGGAAGAAELDVELASVTFSGCVPCGRLSNTLQRRLLAVHVELLGRCLEEDVELAAVGDWNACALNPWEQVRFSLFVVCSLFVHSPLTFFFFFFYLPLTFHFFLCSFSDPCSQTRSDFYPFHERNKIAMMNDFFVPIYGAKPSLKDFILFFLRGFAGFGGSPAGWRSIDGRYSFRVQQGSLAPRLEVDDVFHEPHHGFVDHLASSDHGALRWSMISGSASRTSDDAGVAAADELTPHGVSGAVWEHLSEATAKACSLSSVVLTDEEKAIAGLAPACSRLFQVIRTKGLKWRKLDFLGSDVLGKSVDDWEKALKARVRACEAELYRAKERGEVQAAAPAAAADNAAQPTALDATGGEMMDSDDLPAGGGGADGGKDASIGEDSLEGDDGDDVYGEDSGDEEDYWEGSDDDGYDEEDLLDDAFFY